VLKVTTTVLPRHSCDTIGKQNYQEPGVEKSWILSSSSLLIYLLNNDMWAQKHFAYAHNIRYVMLCNMYAVVAVYCVMLNVKHCKDTRGW